NAVREGARFAVVHTGDSTAAGTTTDAPVFNTDGTFKAGPNNTTVAAVVNYALGSQKGNINTYNVSVFDANPASGAPIAGKQWTDAPFGGSIRNTVTATYAFILPRLLDSSSTTRSVNIQSVMNSEAN